MTGVGIGHYLAENGCVITSSPDGTIRTRHEIGTYSVEVIGLLGDAFPHALPDYYLCERSSFGRLAHVGWPKKITLEGDENLEDVGLICNGSSDALALEYHAPEKVYLAGLEKAISTFERALVDTKWSEKECLREFVGHWQYVATKLPIVLFGESSNKIAELICSRPKKGVQGTNRKPIALLKNLDTGSKGYWPRMDGESDNRVRSGKGILVELPKLIEPPAPDESLNQWWCNCLNVQPDKVQKSLREKARHVRAKEFWIVCRAHVEEQDVWFALVATSTRKEKAPIAANVLDGWKFSARIVEPHTKDYLIPRGGGSRALHNKSVLLVGCGSIGSAIANSLASSGVGNLKLSDPDMFCLDNLYRHSLSMPWDNCLKSQAIAESLRAKYPFTVFEHCDIELMQISEEYLRSVDLVIVAIGNSTHEFAFNEKLVRDRIETPVIYTWLEPNGIGGHAVLTGGNYQDGCHQCNFIIPGGAGNRMLTPNLNFLEPDQKVAQHLGSCGSLFLPYSELDASQTGNLATRLAVNLLLGNGELGRKISWKGNIEDEESTGLIFSSRYYQFKSQLKELPIKNSLCALCSK